MHFMYTYVYIYTYIYIYRHLPVYVLHIANQSKEAKEMSLLGSWQLNVGFFELGQIFDQDTFPMVSSNGGTPVHHPF